MRFEVASSLTGLGLAVLAIVTTVGSATNANSGSGAEPPPPASTAMAATMIRVGLGAEPLAAAGADGQATSNALAAAIAKHGQVSLASADASYANAKPNCDALAQKIQSGLASPEDATAYQQAAAELAALSAARQAALDEIFAAAIATLPEEQRAALTTIHANSHWKLPVQYLVVERAEKDWVTLRDYIDARRIFQEAEEEVPAEVTAYLAAVESAPAVSGAKADLDAGIASIQSAWNAAVSE